jgi:hypothetical protein
MATLGRCRPWRQHPAHATNTSPTRANGLVRHTLRELSALALEHILSGRVIIVTFRKWGRREYEWSVVHKHSCCYACLEEADGHHPRSKFFRFSHLQHVKSVRLLRPQLDGRNQRIFAEGNQLTCLVRAIKAASSQKRKSTLLCTCMRLCVPRQGRHGETGCCARQGGLGRTVPLKVAPVSVLILCSTSGRRLSKFPVIATTRP